VSPTFSRQQSQRVTRRTPSISIAFHPVPSQIAQVTNEMYHRSGGRDDQVLWLIRFGD
jgi:hypothetical protein